MTNESETMPTKRNTRVRGPASWQVPDGTEKMPSATIELAAPTTDCSCGGAVWTLLAIETRVSQGDRTNVATWECPTCEREIRLSSFVQGTNIGAPPSSAEPAQVDAGELRQMTSPVRAAAIGTGPTARWCPLCQTTLVLDTAGRPAPRCPACGWKAG